jgi:hypothetical protein
VLHRSQVSILALCPCASGTQAVTYLDLAVTLYFLQFLGCAVCTIMVLQLLSKHCTCTAGSY